MVRKLSRAGRAASRFCSSISRANARRSGFETLESRRLLANYTWNDAANTLLISLGNNESLTVNEAPGGNLVFELSGGTFAQSGGNAATGDGTNKIRIAAADLATSVTINNNTVTTGTNNVTFGAAGLLSSGAIAVSITDPDAVGKISVVGFHVASTGTGGITLESRRDIEVSFGGQLSTIDGNITLRANQQAVAPPGSFVGISILENGSIVTAGKGNILLDGRGGGTSFPNFGINFPSGKVESTGTGPSAGTITLNGVGGNAPSGAYGIVFFGGQIASVDGDIEITGKAGGDGTGSANRGLLMGGSVVSTGTGSDAANITIHGEGGAGNGSGENSGVFFVTGNVTSKDGNIQITGQPGAGPDSRDILSLESTQIRATGTGTVTVSGVEVPSPSRDADDLIVLGAEAGSRPRVTVIDAHTHEVVASFLAYKSSFRGGVRVAIADLNGDGEAEIIVAPGAGMASLVKVFNLSGYELNEFRTTAYAGFTGGVFVATGDVNGDGRPDLITSPGSGLSSQVKVFKNRVGILSTNTDPISNSPIYSFLAFSGSFKGGATVAAGDLTGDGRAEIVVGNGPGMSPHVRVFDVSRLDPPPTGGIKLGLLAFEIRPFNTADRGGVFVAVGDVRGDATPEIMIGNGVNGRGLVEMYNDDGTRFKSFTAYNTGEGRSAPVHVAAKNVDLNAFDEILTGQGAPGSTAVLRSFHSDGTLMDSILERDDDFRSGFFVA